MNHTDPLGPYISLAEALVSGAIDECSLPEQALRLPEFDASILQALSAQVEQIALARPRLAWALAAVGEAAAQAGGDALLSAQAAWHVARAANEWVEPQRVEAAVQRSQAGFLGLAAPEEQAAPEGRAAPEWQAACEWQRYAQPWTRSDGYQQTIAMLTQALGGLAGSSLHAYAPHCRLSLAYAYIIRGDFAPAEAHISQSEQDFTAAGDALNLARCRLHRASIFRRRGEHEAALQQLRHALPIFEAANARIDLGRATYQLAQVYWRMRHADAEAMLHTAGEIFRQCEVALWEAQCYGALARIYNDAGNLSQARLALDAGSKLYDRYAIPGLIGDHLIDTARLEMFRGNLTTSMQYLTQAKALFTQIDANLAIALTCIYQGQVASQFGRYFQALQYLEQAHTLLQALDSAERMAECEMQLAGIWVKLGRFDQAHRLLGLAGTYFQRNGQNDYLISVYNRQAEAFFLEQKVPAAVACLRQGLELAQQAGGEHQAALSQRLLGEALLALGQADEALPYFESAARTCRELDTRLELAACQIDLGQYHLQAHAYEPAGSAFQHAGDLSADLAPELEWQAYAGLAEIYQAQGQIQPALAQLKAMTHTLSKLRRTLWQPNLAGSYLQRRSALLDRSVQLAAEHATPSETLLLIEESKAQTLSAQLSTPAKDGPLDLPPEAQDLAAEIRWLQEQLQAGAGAQRLFSSQQAQMIQDLRQKNRQYDDLLSRFERRRRSTPAQPPVDHNFDLADFSRQAAGRVAPGWIALDYYLTATHLICAAIIQGEVHIYRREITPEVAFAQRAARSATFPSERDLAVLGNWLLPAAVQSCLTPDTLLIISPHRQLHHIPWPALRVGVGQISLVSLCIPTITPSLHGLSLLWQRTSEAQTPRNGLILAVAQFQGRHRDLPQIVPELQFLQANLRAAGRVLANEAATWDGLKALAQEGGLAQFGFWHIASHVFHDAQTGRQSGLALHERDLWLDDLWDLAPLPGLLVLSACNGTRSLLYAGDEHAGLAVTCLSAGAAQVIGSLWPVLDEAAGDLTAAFYTLLWQGKSPAQALAEAQRQIMAEHPAVERWGGFLCVGAPG